MASQGSSSQEWMTWQDLAVSMPWEILVSCKVPLSNKLWETRGLLSAQKEIGP